MSNMVMLPALLITFLLREGLKLGLRKICYIQEIDFAGLLLDFAKKELHKAHVHRNWAQ